MACRPPNHRLEGPGISAPARASGAGTGGGDGGSEGGWLDVPLRQRFTARFCRLTRNNACADLHRLAELDG